MVARFDPGVLIQDIERLSFRVGSVRHDHSKYRFGIGWTNGTGKDHHLGIRRYIMASENKYDHSRRSIEMVHEKFNQIAMQQKIGLTLAQHWKRCFAKTQMWLWWVRFVMKIQPAMVQATMTGLLVISTIHTGEAAGAVSRMLIWVLCRFFCQEWFGVVAQRLSKSIPVLCHRWLSDRQIFIAHSECARKKRKIKRGRDY